MHDDSKFQAIGGDPLTFMLLPRLTKSTNNISLKKSSHWLRDKPINIDRPTNQHGTWHSCVMISLRCWCIICWPYPMLVDQRRENVEHHRAMDENETPHTPQCMKENNSKSSFLRKVAWFKTPTYRCHSGFTVSDGSMFSM